MYIHTTARKQSILLLAIALFSLCMLFATSLQRADAKERATTTVPVTSQPGQNTPPRREAVQTRVQEGRKTIRENRDVQRDERASTTEVRRENRRERLADGAKARIQAYAEKMWERFTAAITRIEDLAKRIDSRIVKFEERGIDMSEPKRLLVVARVSITEATSAVEAGKTAVDAAITSENPRQAFESVHALARTAHEKIKSAHNALIQAIRLIRANNPHTDGETTATTGENN